MNSARRALAWAGRAVKRVVILAAIVLVTVSVIAIVPAALQALLNNPLTVGTLTLFGAVALYAAVLVVMRIRRTARIVRARRGNS